MAVVVPAVAVILLILVWLSSIRLELDPPAPNDARDRFEELRARAIQNRHLHELDSLQNGQLLAPDAPVVSNEPSPPIFQQFAHWTDRYIPADYIQRNEMIEEGMRLAAARRAELSNMVELNPEAVLALGIPLRIRQQLPQEVLACMEKLFSGTGDLEVGVFLPEVAFGNERPLVERTVRLAGHTYRAHVTGGMRRFGSVENLFMHGVALGDELVLADTPVRAAGDAAAIGRAYSNTGERKLLLIPVEFQDKTGSPYSDDSVRLSRISDLQSYFNTASYGVFTLPTIKTVSLQTMDQNASYYTVSHDGSSGHYVLKDHAVAKALTAGFNQANYDFVSIVINHNLYSWGGLGQVGNKYSWIDGKTSGTGQDKEVEVYTHELGHNLGLYHANAWNPATNVADDSNGTHDEYGHMFDVMGDTGTYNNDQLHYNASFKNALDWLPDSSIATVTADVTLDLHAMDRTQESDRTYAIKIPAGISLGSSSSLNYLIEFRSRFPSNGTLDDGVLIYMSNDSHADEALKLLDMNPATTSVKDAGLEVGNSFTIASARWKLTVNSQTGSGASSLVNVTISDARPPAITTHPADASPAIGDSATFSVTATGPGLAYQWHLDGTAISGATNSSYTISSFQEADKGSYHVVITNSFGTATSNTAALSETSGGGGGGGGCGALPPFNLLLLGWIALAFNRLCLFLNFGVKSRNL